MFVICKNCLTPFQEEKGIKITNEEYKTMLVFKKEHTSIQIDFNDKKTRVHICEKCLKKFKW